MNNPYWHGIELDTPATILKDGNRFYPADTDIFAEIITATGATFENADIFKDALWWRYRNYIIGACDTEGWVQGMADRLNLIGQRWDEIFNKMTDTDLTDLIDRSYEREITRQPIAGTDGDVRTYHNEHETLPQTVATTTKYLDTRADNTETYTPNTRDHEIFQEHDTSNARSFDDMIKAYPNVFVDFTNEFSEYFVQRWY